MDIRLKIFLVLSCAMSLVTSAKAQDDGRLIKIPVIFHVLYIDSAADNGITVDARKHGNHSAYLPKVKLEAELHDLDQDFQATNPDTADIIAEYKNVLGHPKVHFYLDSVIYVKISAWRLKKKTNTDFLHTFSPAVDPQNVLNVYTGVMFFGRDTTNGLTPVPDKANTDSINDCVNLNYKWIGLHYRLLTHEAGHWLGLWHTFEPTDQLSDGITDIPIQSESTNVDCDFCPPKVDDNLSDESKAKGFQHSNYNNFMDYSGCRIMFSIQQAARIRQTIINFRPKIWAASKP